MYILFFGGFILFLDLINFVMDLNKKRKKGFLHNNFLARYFHACDEKNSFIRINHYLCIVGILLSILAQIVTLFNLSNKLAFLEYITLFLICFLFYLSAYQLARALLLHYTQSNNPTIKFLFFISFLFVILCLLGIETYILVQYIFLK